MQNQDNNPRNVREKAIHQCDVEEDGIPAKVVLDVRYLNKKYRPEQNTSNSEEQNLQVNGAFRVSLLIYR
jgi:hypothetical protein